jgi:hypothetical protein
MSNETVMDMSLDTRTELPKDFTCDSQILILSSHLSTLPELFLYKNRFVKTLDMSKCIKVIIVTYNFCLESRVEHIIWPPNIKIIQSKCLSKNFCIQKIDLSYCIQLTKIGSHFCEQTTITDILLPVSIQTISHCFFGYNKTLVDLDLSYCIHLTNIGVYFCADTNIKSIKFPKSLQILECAVCCGSENVKELDFSECKDVKINMYKMYKCKKLKLYSIDNLSMIYKIRCENIYIYNIDKCKSLNLTFATYLQNVHLPEGKYNITGSYSNKTIFWIRSAVFSAEHFSELRWYSYIPVHKLSLIDTPLETI